MILATVCCVDDRMMHICLCMYVCMYMGIYLHTRHEERIVGFSLSFALLMMI